MIRKPESLSVTVPSGVIEIEALTSISMLEVLTVSLNSPAIVSGPNFTWPANFRQKPWWT